MKDSAAGFLTILKRICYLKKNYNSALYCFIRCFLYHMKHIIIKKCNKMLIYLKNESFFLFLYQIEHYEASL